MNGSGANTHTVSPRQVQRMADAIYQAASRFKSDIEGSSNDFFVKLSKQWEDENAVTFAKKFKEKLDVIITSLGDGTFEFVNKIVDIANSYARIAGKGTAVPVYAMRSFSSAIDVSPVKAMFEDESFGLRDDSSISAIEDEYRKLLNKCDNHLSSLRSEILSINAYGNSDVKATINSQAAKLFDNSNSSLVAASSYATNELKKVAVDYKQVSSSIESSHISVNFGGNNSFGGTNSAGVYTTAGLSASSSTGGTNGNGDYTVPSASIGDSFKAVGNTAVSAVYDSAVYDKDKNSRNYLEQAVDVVSPNSDKDYSSIENISRDAIGKENGSFFADASTTLSEAAAYVTTGSVSRLGKQAGSVTSVMAKGISDVSDLAKTAVDDPKLFKEAFEYAIKGGK